MKIGIEKGQDKDLNAKGQGLRSKTRGQILS